MFKIFLSISIQKFKETKNIPKEKMPESCDVCDKKMKVNCFPITDQSVPVFDKCSGSMLKETFVFIDDSGLMKIPRLQASGINFPITDGLPGQQLVTDGIGNLTFSQTSGNVSGPDSSTDSSIPIFDGLMGKYLKDSSATIDSTGMLSVDSLKSSGILFPKTDGSQFQALVTDGSGNLSFRDVALSVNQKVGSVVLSSQDILMSDGSSIQDAVSSAGSLQTASQTEVSPSVGGQTDVQSALSYLEQKPDSVLSVNQKMGSVVLSSQDILMSDGSTIQDAVTTAGLLQNASQTLVSPSILGSSNVQSALFALSNSFQTASQTSVSPAVSGYTNVQSTLTYLNNMFSNFQVNGVLQSSGSINLNASDIPLNPIIQSYNNIQDYLGYVNSNLLAFSPKNIQLQDPLSSSSYGIYWITNGNVYSMGSTAGTRPTGSGSSTDRFLPCSIGFRQNGPSSIVKLIATVSTFAILGNNGSVYTVGFGGNGERGDGTFNADRQYFDLLGGLIISKNIVNLWGTTMNATDPGSASFIALASDNSIWAWGNQSNGHLGFGNTYNISVPTQVGGLLSMKTLSKVFIGKNDQSWSLALCTDGTLYGCGYNASGQLGLGTTTDVYFFNACNDVSGPITNVQDVCGSFRTGFGGFSMVLKQDGTVWTCGQNGQSQCGDGTTTNRTKFVQVLKTGSVPLSGIVKISCSNSSCYALDSSGVLWGWGYNNDGELNQNSVLPISLATVVSSNISNFWSLSFCNACSTLFFLDNSGVIKACGRNGVWQCGTGIETGGNLLSAQKICIENNIGTVTDIRYVGYSNGTPITGEFVATLLRTNTNRLFVAGNVGSCGLQSMGTSATFMPIPLMMYSF
jgi:alpha-tubulin suppressor-like RCC1 family protein